MQDPDRYRKGSHALIRELNMSVIVGHLRRSGTASRTSLAAMTGLSKAAVGSVISELIEHRFVREVGPAAGSNGRPSIRVELNPQAGCVVSGELGVDFILVVCTNFAAEIIWRRREPITPDMDQQTVIGLLRSCLQAAASAGQASCGPLLGVAVGAAALVDRRTGTVLLATNMGWNRTGLQAALQESFDVPVYVDNEFNVAVMGEYYFGKARACSDVLYVGADIGMGGAILHEGELFGGQAALTGRLGHMTLDPNGEACNCGNRGCWETVVNRRAIFRAIMLRVNEGCRTVLTEMTGGDLDRLDISMVIEAARAGDAVALETFEQVGHYLGLGLASLVNVLNPQLIVLGNIFSQAGEFVLPFIYSELHKHVLCWDENTVEVALSEFGSDACVIGGVAAVYERILPQPRRVIRQQA